MPDVRNTIADRNANLDLVRALAITMVLIFHVVPRLDLPGAAILQVAQCGKFGVDLFFVLSGFLIGGLYWRERVEFDSVHRCRFVLRRALRTMPPYFVALAISWLAVYVARGDGFDPRYLFFLQNYGQRLPFFQVSWSLCIEEHFYLALPLVFGVVSIRRPLIPAIVLPLLAIGPALLRGFHYLANASLSYDLGYSTTATHLHCDGLILGVFAAYLFERHKSRVAPLTKLRVPIYVAAVVVVLTMPSLPAALTYTAGYTVLAVVFTLCVLAGAADAPYRLSRLRPVVFLALTSYSTYLTHALVLNLCDRFCKSGAMSNRVLHLGMMIGGALAAGGMFYVLVERTALRIRDKLVERRPRARTISATRGQGGLCAGPTLLIISQVYVPDPAAVGQYFHDTAAELARRGMRVRVLTSRAGYEDPNQRYARREVRDGVEICRLPWSNFGKHSIPFRLLGAASFLVQAIVHALFLRRIDGLLVSTSPPLGPIAALAIAAVRRVPIVYWAMDINPDQAVALGRFRAGGLPVRCMERLNRAILRRAERIITLDRFMAERLRRKQDCGARIAVIPPWPLDDGFEPIDRQENPFRREQALDGQFVVMYSGNMSIAHPLRTVLRAAHRLRDRKDLLFLFVGGGLGRRGVERFVAENGNGNIRILPYQPCEQLRYSLSAADVHLVSMGDDMVGIVHPSKIYGAMACGRPILLLGPRGSHAGELIAGHRIGWQVEHEDVDGMVAAIRKAMTSPRAVLAEMGCRARTAIRCHLSRSSMRQAVCDEIEAAMAQACFFTSAAPAAVPAQPAAPALAATAFSGGADFNPRGSEAAAASLHPMKTGE